MSELRKQSQENKRKVRECMEKGLPAREIADCTGMSLSCVYRIMDEEETPEIKTIYQQKQKVYSDHETEIVNNYLKGMKVDEIGEQYNLSRYKTEQILTKHQLSRDVRNQLLLERIKNGETMQDIMKTTLFKRSFLYSLAKENGLVIVDISRRYREERVSEEECLKKHERIRKLIDKEQKRKRLFHLVEQYDRHYMAKKEAVEKSGVALRTFDAYLRTYRDQMKKS